MQTSLSQMVLESGAMINSMHGNWSTFDVVRQHAMKSWSMGDFPTRPLSFNTHFLGQRATCSCGVLHGSSHDPCWVAETAEVNANNKMWREETLDMPYWQNFMAIQKIIHGSKLVGVHYIQMAAKSLAEMWNPSSINHGHTIALAPLFHTANLNIGFGKPIQTTSITRIMGKFLEIPHKFKVFEPRTVPGMQVPPVDLSPAAWAGGFVNNAANHYYFRWIILPKKNIHLRKS